MSLRDVEAQDRAIETLLRALVSGRLHHAYLFAGPDGVGKGLAAMALAQALLCTAPRDDGDGCGTCKGCARIADRHHPDLHVVERLPHATRKGELEKTIKIAQVRELQRDLSFKAFEGDRRVVVLREAERMTANTANALLKTLEEPRAGTHFVLVSASPHLLLPTIISRCQRVRFAPLPRAVVARHLAEKADLEPADADLLAALAEGSIGKGLALAESPILEHRAAFLAQVDDPDGLHRVPELIELAEKLARETEELPLYFHLLRTWYRDVLMVQTGMGPEVLVHRDLFEQARARAATVSPRAVMARLERVNDVESALARQANPRLSLETLLLGLVGVDRGL